MRSDDLSGYRMILLLALLLICGATFAIYKIAPAEARIASRERVITGHFVAHVGQGKSSRIIYAYSVDGLSYEKRDSCWNWLMPCKIGSEVAVYYDPLNPAESKIMDYRRDRARGIKFCSICITVGIFLLGLYFVLIKRARERCAAQCADPE